MEPPINPAAQSQSVEPTNNPNPAQNTRSKIRAPSSLGLGGGRNKGSPKPPPSPKGTLRALYVQHLHNVCLNTQWDTSSGQLVSGKSKSLLAKAKASLNDIEDKNIVFTSEDLPCDMKNIEGRVVLENFQNVHKFIWRQ